MLGPRLQSLFADNNVLLRGGDGILSMDSEIPRLPDLKIVLRLYCEAADVADAGVGVACVWVRHDGCETVFGAG